MNLAVWGPILAALLGGGLVQAIISYAGRKKTDAETTDLITQAAERIVARLEVEVNGLRDEISKQNEIILKQNEEIRSLRQEVTVLRNEVQRLGGDPDQLMRR